MQLQQVRGIHDSYTSPPDYPIFKTEKNTIKKKDGISEIAAAISEAAQLLKQQTTPNNTVAQVKYKLGAWINYQF